MEIWRDIEGYEGIYQVSNKGRIKHFKNGIRKLSLKKNGYYGICLYNHRKYENFLIHRLVAEAFIPNKDNLPMVNHKDENKLNNNVDNLEWCDAKYNSNYGTRKERLRKIRGKKVLCIETGKIYNSIGEASEILHISRPNINKCLYHKRKTAGGYHWKFLD